VQLGFGLEDDEAFAGARDALVEGLMAWAAERGLDLDPDPVGSRWR
jgi:hypothetical protein